jgi:DNA gyrase/topoisomerase IV subunit A
VITPEKIEEWIKEVEERPISAPAILRYIASRLSELSGRNEALLAENIALVTGKRVEEYERRIAHLEYQLELLKRQMGGEPSLTGDVAEASQPEARQAAEPLNLLAYDAQGRVLRWAIDPARLASGMALGRLQGELEPGREPPRLLVVSSTEELLFVFSSGRVATLPVTGISPARLEPGEASITLDWSQAPAPDEPRAGEVLACLAPISKLALAGYFVQVSRRAFVKKIRTSMAQSILANHYIGTGVKQPTDRTFDLMLCRDEDRLVLVSWEGYLTCLETRQLSPSIEPVMRLGATDHLVAAFITGSGRSALVATQIGKTILRLDESLETASSFKTKGQAVFSEQRREKGVRVVGAASVSENDWGVALDREGQLTLHALRDVFATGTIPMQGELSGFTAFSVD